METLHTEVLSVLLVMYVVFLLLESHKPLFSGNVFRLYLPENNLWFLGKVFVF